MVLLSLLWLPLWAAAPCLVTGAHSRPPPASSKTSSSSTYSSSPPPPRSPRTPISPDHESAAANAFHIFNAVHSIGRQWGSSINDNGFSFVPAVIPAGNLLYHGSLSPDTPGGPEWLSFEVEHAEFFALATAGSLSSQESQSPALAARADLLRARFKARSESQKVLQSTDGDDSGKETQRGYLQTYRASRDLNLLLFDGMSAAKSPPMGTLDSQDLVMREGDTDAPMDFLGEMTRAKNLCNIVVPLGYDGIIRTETGFEVIYCDFASGVTLASRTRLIPYEERLAGIDIGQYQWARAAIERYDGVGGDRLHLDFSSMVSGFFFPINISSPAIHSPDRIRLGAAGKDELKDIKKHVLDVIRQPRRFTVNWQSVVDMIETRFAERLSFMASPGISARHFMAEVDTAALTHFDAPLHPEELVDPESDQRRRVAEATERCVELPLTRALLSRKSWSLEDELIHTAVKTTLREICHSLLSSREILAEAKHRVKNDDHNGGTGGGKDDKHMDDALKKSKKLLVDLTRTLAWTRWKKTRPCSLHGLSFVAMFPFGTPDDHWNPGCRAVDDMQNRNGYWEFW